MGGDVTTGPIDVGRGGVEATRVCLDTVLALASVWLFVDAGSLPESRWEPLGAGAFPRMVFGLLALLCGLSALAEVRRLVARDSPLDMRALGASSSRWWRERWLVVPLLALFGAYLYAVPRAGFSLATLVFMGAASALLAPRRYRAWLVAAVLAVTFSYGLNALFANVFDVFLPRGTA